MVKSQRQVLRKISYKKQTMKTKTLFLLTLIAGALLSCNPRVRHDRIGIFDKATPFIGSNPKNGIFATVAIYDPQYDSIEYQTTQRTFRVVNDGTASCIIGRYDTTTYELIWVAVAGGKGDDKACNYFTILGADNAVYVGGYFSDTAYFPTYAGNNQATSVISHGKTDMFLAKYSYDDGVLRWVNAGGSSGYDLGYTYLDSGNNTFMHDEASLLCDSSLSNLYLWAKCKGPNVEFVNAQGTADDLSIASDSTKYVKVTFNGTSGLATAIQLDSIMPY